MIAQLEGRPVDMVPIAELPGCPPDIASRARDRGAVLMASGAIYARRDNSARFRRRVYTWLCSDAVRRGHMDSTAADRIVAGLWVP